jgi:hypothetical protein
MESIKKSTGKREKHKKGFIVRRQSLSGFLSSRFLPAPGKSRDHHPVNGYLLQEHRQWSHPAGKITVKTAVHDHKLFRFAVPGDGYDFVIVAFVVAVPAGFDFGWLLIHHGS